MKSQNRWQTQPGFSQSGKTFHLNNQTSPEDFYPKEDWNPENFDFNDLKKKKVVAQFMDEKERSRDKINKASDGWTTEAMDNFVWEGGPSKTRRFGPKGKTSNTALLSSNVKGETMDAQRKTGQVGLKGEQTSLTAESSKDKAYDIARYLTGEDTFSKSELSKKEVKGDIGLSDGNIDHNTMNTVSVPFGRTIDQEYPSLQSTPEKNGSKTRQKRFTTSEKIRGNSNGYGYGYGYGSASEGSTLNGHSQQLSGTSEGFAPRKSAFKFTGEVRSDSHTRCFSPVKEEKTRIFSSTTGRINKKDPKPPFCNYGAANTKPVVGGLVWGNYLKTFNANPQRSPNLPKETQLYQTAQLGMERQEFRNTLRASSGGRSHSPDPNSRKSSYSPPISNTAYRPTSLYQSSEMNPYSSSRPTGLYQSVDIRELDRPSLQIDTGTQTQTNFAPKKVSFGDTVQNSDQKDNPVPTKTAQKQSNRWDEAPRLDGIVSEAAKKKLSFPISSAIAKENTNPIIHPSISEKKEYFPGNYLQPQTKQVIPKHWNPYDV